jgi:hypothetical protein
VADVFFGQLVVCQVNRLELLLVEFGCDLATLVFNLGDQTPKRMGLVQVAHAVIELRHILIEFVVFMSNSLKNSSKKQKQKAK